MAKRWFGCVCGAGLIALAIAAFAPSAFQVFANPHGEVRVAKDDPRFGKLAAEATLELFRGTQEYAAFSQMMNGRRSAVLSEKRLLHRDPYLPWLAAMFAQSAATGRLFSREDGKIYLTTSFETGDDLHYNTLHAFHYIGVVAMIDADGSSRVVGRPWLMWKGLGSLPTPRDPDDRPWEEKILLSSVEAGDIVQLDVYRIRQDQLDDEGGVSASHAVIGNVARLALRIPLPVVIADSGAAEKP